MAFGIVNYDHNGKFICGICGKSFHKMSRHLKAKHKTNARKYRHQFGLDRNTPLMSKQSQINAKERFKRDKDVIMSGLIETREATIFKDGNAGRKKEKVREQTRLRLGALSKKVKGKKNLQTLLQAQEERIQRNRLDL